MTFLFIVIYRALFWFILTSLILTPVSKTWHCCKFYMSLYLKYCQLQKFSTSVILTFAKNLSVIFAVIFIICQHWFCMLTHKVPNWHLSFYYIWQMMLQQNVTFHSYLETYWNIYRLTLTFRVFWQFNWMLDCQIGIWHLSYSRSTVNLSIALSPTHFITIEMSKLHLTTVSLTISHILWQFICQTF